MPRAESFILKDSDPELIKAAEAQPQGRTYSPSYRNEPGSVRIAEVVKGMQYAIVAVTDDDKDTLKIIGKSNPWHKKALKMITGSKENAYKPLSRILYDHMNRLKLDKFINVSGMNASGHILDTQGYIAHNDTTIVLSFRCSTTLKDWLTNLTTFSSSWELDEDVAQGHSGLCSGLEGFYWCFGADDYKPKVHTGFYNNFLAVVPYIKEYIDPLLLNPNEPPRDLYVVGHSLGGAIATLATCYFLLEYDWANLPHKLLSITAGSPRTCQQSMVDLVEEKISELRPLDKVVVNRIVLDRDVVTKIPPALFGFRHIGKLIYITEDEYLLVNPKVEGHISEREMGQLSKGLIDEAASEHDGTEQSNLSKYERIINKIPKPFRDHMPDLYLTPLLNVLQREYGKIEGMVVDSLTSKNYDKDILEGNSSDLSDVSDEPRRSSKLKEWFSRRQ